MKPLQFTARLIGALAVAAMGFLFFATFTTAGWGLSAGWWWQSLGSVAGFSLVAWAIMAPISWLPFLGCSRRVIWMGMIGIPLISVVGAEVFGRSQEWLVQHRYGLTPSEPVYLHRWWPFEHHEIAFQPGSGWTGWN
jgi:hypothetical protein